MVIIKEHSANHIVIRTNTYAHSLAHLNDLLAIAQSDFPTLTPDQVHVRVYGGERYKRTMGIEFIIPSADALPPDYVAVDQLEYTLN